ncbi:MAG TPA: tetratricopeptide repeat protein [Candidatus Baltobacteraceae bacterium]|nr:tetratricopeptide repeat protein [Candidatus Baltobacteraceae bacterium]
MRHFVLVLFAALAVGVMPAAASAQTVDQQLDPHYKIDLPSDPLAAMNAARDRVAAGKLEGAITGLQSYVANHPGEIGPERLLGDLYFRKTDLPQAEATYKHILTYAPNDKETHNRLGSVYATENRIDQAIDEFNHSLPGTDAVPDLVRLHMRRGDLNAYKHMLEVTAQEYPSSGEAQSEIGEVYETIGQPEVAERFFKRALDDDPGNLIATNNLGLAYMDEKRYSDAIKTFSGCLVHDAYNYGCKDNLAAVYLHESLWGQADVLLQQAHTLAPERPEALVNLGYLADARGDWKKAVVYYIMASTVYPYGADAYANLGVTYNEHGLYQLAQAALIKGLAVAPEDGRLHFILGETYSHQGNLALAADQYRAAALGSDIDEWTKRTAQQRVTALMSPRPTSTPQ